MNRDDIIRMAREAGIDRHGLGWTQLERFAALVAAAEREAYERLAMVHSAAMAEAHDVRQRMDAEMAPVNTLMTEISELHDKVSLLMDELSDMERASFSKMAVMRQALTALEGVVSAHSYESGTLVDAIAALRRGLGESK